MQFKYTHIRLFRLVARWSWLQGLSFGVVVLLLFLCPFHCSSPEMRNAGDLNCLGISKTNQMNQRPWKRNSYKALRWGCGHTWKLMEQIWVTEMLCSLSPDELVGYAQGSTPWTEERRMCLKHVSWQIGLSQKMAPPIPMDWYKTIYICIYIEKNIYIYIYMTSSFYPWMCPFGRMRHFHFFRQFNIFPPKVMAWANLRHLGRSGMGIKYPLKQINKFQLNRIKSRHQLRIT